MSFKVLAAFYSKIREALSTDGYPNSQGASKAKEAQESIGTQGAHASYRGYTGAQGACVYHGYVGHMGTSDKSNLRAKERE